LFTSKAGCSHIDRGCIPGTLVLPTPIGDMIGL